MALSLDQAKKVLKPFFDQPSKPRYLREVERESGVSYERVCHHLGELEKSGAVFSEKRRKIKEYRLNKEHDLVCKIFGILEMERRQEFLSGSGRQTASFLRLKEALLKAVGDSTKFIILFGSIARGHEREKSDVDILAVIAQGGKGVKKRIRLAEQDLNAISPSHFSIQAVALPEFRRLWKKEPAYAAIWQDRIVLFGEENFWREVLKLGEPA